MEKTKILVVEDESVIAMELEDRLARLGYTVSGTASSADAAFKSMEVSMPDVVLMDIHIKGPKDGIQTAEEIRSRFAIPVVYLTAHADDTTLRRAKITEPFGYLLKPFREQELRVAIEIAMYKRDMERRLRESQSRFDGMVQSAYDAIISVDENQNIILFNVGAERVFGWKAEEILGQSLDVLLPPEMTASHRQRMQEYNREDAPNARRMNAHQETQARRHDGTIFPTEISVSKAVINERNVYTAIVHDITHRKQAEDNARRLNAELERRVEERTVELNEVNQRLQAELAERKKAEEALRDSEAQFRAVVENAPVVIATLDRDGVIQFINRTTLYHQKRQVIGTSVYEYLPIETQKQVRDVLKSVFETDSAQSYESLIVRADGTRVWYDNHVAPLHRGGQVYAALHIASDITAHKQAEEQILYQANLVASASDAIIATDMQFNVQSWNAAAESMYGWTVADVIGQPLSDFFHTDYLDGTLEDAARQVMEKGFWRGEVVQSRRDGARIPVLSSVTLFKDGAGKPQGFVAVNRDITERKQMDDERRKLYEQARQDALVKAELLEEVNHRVKNSLVSIQGILQMEKRQAEKSGGDARLILADMQNRINGMLIVHSMLSRSQWSPLALGELIEKTIEGAVSASPIRSSIRVETAFRPVSCRKRTVISRQATALALIINELVTNSVKYAFADCTNGRIMVDAEIQVTDDQSSMLTVVYRDDGKGWDQDALEGRHDGVGLRLIRGAMKGLPSSALTLSNDDGAVTTICFKLAAA